MRTDVSRESREALASSLESRSARPALSSAVVDRFFPGTAVPAGEEVP